MKPVGTSDGKPGGGAVIRRILERREGIPRREQVADLVPSWRDRGKDAGERGRERGAMHTGRGNALAAATGSAAMPFASTGALAARSPPVPRRRAVAKCYAMVDRHSPSMTGSEGRSALVEEEATRWRPGRL
jgi:hypothetical protein